MSSGQPVSGPPVIEDLGQTAGEQDYGPNRAAIDELVERARRLSPHEARAIAGALAWQWVPLGLPSAGGFASARSTAIVEARRLGRGSAVAAADAAARAAALESPGGRARVPGWASAENALPVTFLAIIGVVLGASSGMAALTAVAFIVAVASSAVLLMTESRFVLRSRLAAAAGSAAIALAVRDVVSPEVSSSLLAPWRAVVHD
jgi:hypothetical protein